MDDFYKKIKESVDGIPEVASSKNDWDSFQSFRSEKNAGPAKPFPWLLTSALGLIFLLIGTNIFWATRSAHQAESFALSTIHDTIYITQVIENTNSDLSNTVAFLESQLQKNKESLAIQNNEYSLLYSQFVAQNNRLSSLKEKLDQQHSKLSLFFNKEHNKINVITSNPSSQFQSVDNSESEDRFSSLSLVNIGVLPSKELAYNRLRILHPSSIFWIKNKRPFSLKNAMKPKSLSLNFNTGYQLNLGESHDNYAGLYYSLRATTIFTKNVRGYLGITFFKGRNEVEDWANYRNIPMIQIPDDDKLKEVKVAKSSVGINIGLEYMIYRLTRWRSFVGLGYAQSLSNKDKFSFEIESPFGEYYISPEGGVDQAQLKQMIFSLGTDYNLSSELDLRSAITYYQGLTSYSFSSINFTGGVYYHF